MIKFICSATRIIIPSSQITYEIYGQHHDDVLQKIHQKGLIKEYHKHGVDGFIIDEDGQRKFIDTFDATLLAKRLGFIVNGQVVKSTDIWSVPKEKKYYVKN